MCRGRWSRNVRNRKSNREPGVQEASLPESVTNEHLHPPSSRAFMATQPTPGPALKWKRVRGTRMPRRLFSYGYKPQGRFYFENLDMDLDMPGEYYIDSETGDVFLNPPKGVDLRSANVYLSHSRHAIQMDGAQYITIRGLEFHYYKGDIIDIRNSAHVRIDKCVLANSGANALSMTVCPRISPLSTSGKVRANSLRVRQTNVPCRPCVASAAVCQQGLLRGSARDPAVLLLRHICEAKRACLAVFALLQGPQLIDPSRATPRPAEMPAVMPNAVAARRGPAAGRLGADVYSRTTVGRSRLRKSNWARG